MGVLRSVRADTITSCNGVVHLPAGHHTFAVEDNCTFGVSYCPRCTIVGEPGAVLDALVSTHNRVIALNGSLVLRGTGQSPCLDIQRGFLRVHGNVTIQDCHNMNVQSLFILGPNSGEEMVSVTNSSTTAEASVRVTNNAHVIFTDAYFPGGENELLYIENSHAIFERTRASAQYGGYAFTNSTIIASNTVFGGGHNSFSASNSVLNFTNTSVFIVTGSMGISVANCSLDVTCTSPGPVFDVGPYNTYVSFSDSMVRFRGCSCHLDQAIRNSGTWGRDPASGPPVSIQGGSMTFSSCQPAKANPVVVV